MGSPALVMDKSEPDVPDFSIVLGIETRWARSWAKIALVG